MKGRLLWLTLAALLLVAGLATGSTIAFRLSYVLFAVPVIGLGMAALAARGLDARVRRVTAYLQVGDYIEEEISLRSLHWWPKLLIEARHATTPFASPGRVLSLWPYQSATWKTRTRAERRGLYEHGIVDVTLRDPFGLFERRRMLGKREAALIYPATVELPGFHVPAGRGWSEGIAAGRTLLPSPVAAGVRDFSAGDAANRVHWPTSLRVGRLMVKEFDREPAGPSDSIWVVLDLYEAAQAGTGVESTVEYAVTIAASVARRFLDGGRTVGLVIGGQEHTQIAADTGPAQLGRVLQALALAEPGASGPLLQTVTRAGGLVLPDTTAVIVTPGGPAETAAAVAFYQGREATAVPILLEAGSFRGEPSLHGGAYRLPGGGVDTYVIHKGDDIQRRLDYATAGHAPFGDIERAAAG
ncbi:MAG: DUF58 domain-containing protein [Chloroflexota bacterium]|nr:DUF58 domain-containing protein [Chloroflexota bacterium]